MKKGTYKAFVVLILGFAAGVFVIQMLALNRLSAPVSRYPWEDDHAVGHIPRSMQPQQHQASHPLNNENPLSAVITDQTNNKFIAKNPKLSDITKLTQVMEVPGKDEKDAGQEAAHEETITTIPSKATPTPVAPIHFCDIQSKDAQSAIHRAKTESCRNMIRNITCLSEAGKLYDTRIKHLCTLGRNPVRKFKSVPFIEGASPPARVVFLMSIHGRAFRQVKRLFKALYHTRHYFYIHVDSRSDYLYRQILEMSKGFDNVYIPTWRIPTIWGGASLLQMLLRSLEDLELILRDWEWDFFINMSESDYPIKTNKELVEFLTAHRGTNFVKSHGGDINKFIQKQGLDRTFVECENHMWRVGNRQLPHDLVIDGGSDWIVLTRNYSRYLATDKSNFLTGLKQYYELALLPAESFFHTVLRNGPLCGTFVRSNLRITNWNRKLGCRCQYKHIVDWCGCSPNDFLPKDIERLKNPGEAHFFARKFEAIVNQQVITDLDAHLYGSQLAETPGVNSYWENVFHDDDDVTKPSSARYTVYNSFMSLGHKLMLKKEAGNQSESSTCPIPEHPILEEVTVYRQNDKFVGFVVTFGEVSPRLAEEEEGSYMFEVLVSPVSHFKQTTKTNSDVQARVTSIEVGSQWDGKESVFRNYGGVLGVHDEIELAIRAQMGRVVFTEVVWEDPVGEVASRYNMKLDSATTVATHKPKLSKPIRPGIWNVKILHSEGETFMHTTFLVTPVKYDKKVPLVNPAVVNGRLAHDKAADGVDLHLYSQWKERALSTKNQLDTWIEELVTNFWRIEAVCSTAAGQCRSLVNCRETSWSTLSPDPKSELGPVLSNGRLR